MTFSDLSELIEQDVVVRLYNEEHDIICSNALGLTKYDELEVISISVDGMLTSPYDPCICVTARMPEWTVSGTVTIDLDITLRAPTEQAALEAVSNLEAESFFNEVRFTARSPLDYSEEGFSDISLDCGDIEWDGAEIL